VKSHFLYNKAGLKRRSLVYPRHRLKLQSSDRASTYDEASYPSMFCDAREAFGSLLELPLPWVPATTPPPSPPRALAPPPPQRTHFRRPPPPPRSVVSTAVNLHAALPCPSCFQLQRSSVRWPVLSAACRHSSTPRPVEGGSGVVGQPAPGLQAQGHRQPLEVPRPYRRPSYLLPHQAVPVVRGLPQKKRRHEVCIPSPRHAHCPLIACCARAASLCARPTALPHRDIPLSLT
jgi:hypothetical protein